MSIAAPLVRILAMSALLWSSAPLMAQDATSQQAPPAEQQAPEQQAPGQQEPKQQLKQELKPAHRSLFKDPEDGKFDVSHWLLERKGGFLPVPIVITDPAVGTGGGIAAAFFHRPQGAATSRTNASGKQVMISPDIYGAAVMRTSNGSQAYGVGASLHFDEDRWRYRGGVAKSSFNLGFYTPGTFLPSQKIDYNVDGIMSFQQVFRRLGDQDLFLGLAWIYMDLDIGFDVESDRDLFKATELAQRSSGLGLSLEYDNRDNPFTPSRGWLGMVEGNFYGEAIGSDATFQSYRSHAFGYVPLLGEKLVLGGRVDVRWANGDIPFYRLPYIDLRGIGSARYQDTRAATVETELRWNLTPRWALIGFAGAGRTWGRRNDFADGEDEIAKGAGFRYLIARQLGM